MKIRTLLAELFHPDRRMKDRGTDITKLIVAFRNLVIAPENLKNTFVCNNICDPEVRTCTSP